MNMQICRVYGKIARYLKTTNKKQKKNDQQVFGDENFIFIIFFFLTLFENSLANLLFILSSIRTISIENERKKHLENSESLPRGGHFINFDHSMWSRKITPF